MAFQKLPSPPTELNAPPSSACCAVNKTKRDKETHFVFYGTKILQSPDVFLLGQNVSKENTRIEIVAPTSSNTSHRTPVPLILEMWMGKTLWCTRWGIRNWQIPTHRSNFPTTSLTGKGRRSGLEGTPWLAPVTSPSPPLLHISARRSRPAAVLNHIQKFRLRFYGKGRRRNPVDKLL